MRYLLTMALVATTASCAATKVPPSCDGMVAECKYNCAPRHPPTGQDKDAELGTSSTGPKSTKSCDEVCENLCSTSPVPQPQARAD